MQPIVLPFSKNTPITGFSSPPNGVLLHTPRIDLGPSFAGAVYTFFLTGTSTATPVYQDGNLANPFSPTSNTVTADSFGRFPAIYLDSTIAYKVVLTAAVIPGGSRTTDPYNVSLATTGNSQLDPTGIVFSALGEALIVTPASGGSGVTLTLNATPANLGAALALIGSQPGTPLLIVNNSVTTGVQTATFTATNKPGTATSAPVGWLPIKCDGVIYYIPLWFDNNFSRYGIGSAGAATAPIVNAASFTFNGDGSITLVGAGATAVPSQWFAPLVTGEGTSYFIGITKTSGLAGLDFLYPVTATVAPSGATYVGGNLTANFTGTTLSTYSIILSTGQQISGCTFTNGATAFTTPSTSINPTPTATISIVAAPEASVVWENITANGLAISANGSAQIVGSYGISTSLTGIPLIATGTITLAGGNGVQGQNLNNGFLVYNTNGTMTFGGGSTPTNWYLPTTTASGSNFFINVTQTSGSGTFGGITNNTWTAMSPAINLYAVNASATGTVQISTTASTAGLLASNTLTLGASTSCPQVAIFSGAGGQADFKSNGQVLGNSDLFHASDWYLPNTTGIGSSFWLLVHKISGTATLTGITDNVWTALSAGVNVGCSGTRASTLTATYSISSNSGGTVICATGQFSISVPLG